MKVIYVLLTLAALGFIFQGAKSCTRSGSEVGACPLTLADSYTLQIRQEDATKLGDKLSETYEVKRADAKQVDLVCKVNKSTWLTYNKVAIIRISFNPSQGAPYYGSCVEIDEEGKIDKGSVKLTPNGGGFIIEYWEENPAQYNMAKLEPNWY